jgi:hypothetical protein
MDFRMEGSGYPGASNGHTQGPGAQPVHADRGGAFDVDELLAWSTSALQS